MKAEHARYQTALERICETYGNAARLLAKEALNPPPLLFGLTMFVLCASCAWYLYNSD